MSTEALSEAGFWQIISEFQNSSRSFEHLQSLLESRGPAQIVEFAIILERLIVKAHLRDLAVANLIVRGYISDDEFEEFRAWLVFNGRDRYEAALANPDSISDWLTEDAVEQFNGVDPIMIAENAYLKFGSEDEYWDRKYGQDYPNDPQGVMDIPGDESVIESVCPTLYQRFWKGFAI